MRTVRYCQSRCGASDTAAGCLPSARERIRSGKILVLFAVLLPSLMAIVALIIDGGMLQGTYRRTQHIADAAAVAAAREMQRNPTTSSAEEAVDASRRNQKNNRVQNNSRPGGVRVNSPPEKGPFRSDPSCVEVEIGEVQTFFYGILGSESEIEVCARAVAGVRPSTTGAAIVVLDPDPPPLSVPAFPGILPALPALIGGLEIEGVGTVRVDGAVLVNTNWGGRDENGDPIGDSAPPPYAVASINLLTPQRLRARDIRVSGGVDDPDAYGSFVIGESSPLQTGKLAVSDPFSTLPVPTMSADPAHVSPVPRGGVRVAGLPIGPVQMLNPGVYDWIEIVSGQVRFNPGVYIIRSVNPITQIALNILAGDVQGDGVMFYITNSSGYGANSGAPDSGDGETQPPAPGVLNLLPSAVINLALPTCRLTGINDPDSPFDGMLIYQRRVDRRPVAIVSGILGAPRVQGTIYAKWGHVILATQGTVETSVVAGTVRIVTVLPTTIAPTRLLPPAEDVYLLE